MIIKNLSDRQLISLFKVTATPILSARAKAILTELSKRGYFYDNKGDFLTAEQWKQRYQQPPVDTFYGQLPQHE